MKPTLALISSYNDDSCANATYARLLEKTLNAHFDVTVFSLDPSLMKPTELTGIANTYVTEICDKLQHIDFVNLHLELGLYGDSTDVCLKRIKQFCKASQKLIFTLHGIDLKSPSFTPVYREILINLKGRPNEKPFHIITHTEIQCRQIQSVFGIKNVSDYPVTYITEDEKKRIFAIDKMAWKNKLGFKPDDIVIGLFGIWAESKNRIWALKALELLPDQYKLAFFGGIHPLSIKPFEVNANTKLITDFFEDKTKHDPQSTLINRIKCFGVIDNDAFFNEAMGCIDFCVAPYYENGQSASGTTSIALELGSKLITTYTHMFVAHRKYWPNAFEMFDIGNYIELRDKILYFSPDKAENAKKHMNDYTPEKLADYYLLLSQQLIDPSYQNITSPTTAMAHARLQKTFTSCLSKLKSKLYRAIRPIVKKIIKRLV